jgi:hypothetical protein
MSAARAIIGGAAAKLSHDDEADLCWYFNESDGDVGGLRAIQYNGDPHPSRGQADWKAIEHVHERLYMVQRWRRIDRRVQAITMTQRRVLLLAFGELPLGLEGLPGPAILTASARKLAGRKAHYQSVAEAIMTARRERTSPARILLSRILFEADALIEDAARAYRATRMPA